MPGDACTIEDDGASIAGVRDCAGLCADPLDRFPGVCDVAYHCEAFDFDDEDCLSDLPGGYCVYNDGIDGILSCYGACVPAEAFGDGACTLVYSCQEFGFDHGDCDLSLSPGDSCMSGVGMGSCDGACVFADILGDGTCDPELDCVENGLDDGGDCVDKDVDDDGHNGSSYGGDDCDDNNGAIYPGAVEFWYDGVDQDCSATSDFDQDGDGYDSAAYGGEDCDDTNPNAGPENGDIVDCNGDCFPEGALDDGHCDQALDCGALSEDDGDCSFDCPHAFFGGHLYLFCSDTKDWATAALACSTAYEALHLVKINDSAENVWIGAEINAISTSAPWWVGLNDKATEGTFVWHDGSTGGFVWWQPNEPNNAGNEDCVATYPPDSTLNDGLCASTFRYVCERD